MPSKNRDNYFKLVAFIVDIAYLVIWKYIKENILGPDSFESFLNKEKHKLVHVYETSRCCECVVEKKIEQRLISRKQLKLLYKSDETKQIGGHKKYVGNKLSQTCICKYSAMKNVGVNVIDITLATFIIQKCGKHELGVDNWIEQIKDVKNEIFRLSNIQETTEEKFDRHWTILEGSILGIAKFINSAYTEETERKILQTKKMSLITDYMLKCEIRCHNYWRNRYAEFERVKLQEFEEKAAALQINFPQFLGSMKTNYKITMRKIYTLENIVDQINIMIKSFENLENMEMSKATDFVDGMQRIHLPVFLQLKVPASWDKTTVFKAIDELRLKGTQEMDIRIKAIPADDHKMFAEIAFKLIRNAHTLRSGIDKIWTCKPTEVSVISKQHFDMGSNFRILYKADMESQAKNNYFRLVALLVDIACLVIRKYIKDNILGSDDLEAFLNKEKHKFVHMYETSECCKCFIRKMSGERLISRKQLLSLYDSDERRQIHQHKKYSGRKLTQFCMCKYSAKINVDIKVIDITLANCIIQKCGKHELGVDIWIEQIKDVRNEIFHFSDIQEITDENFCMKWKRLEGSILGIAKSIDISYAEETRNKILQTKNLIIISDHMLKYEILCSEYWKTKCAEFETTYLKENNEKAADQQYNLPKISSQATETECRRTLKGIQTLETMVDKISILIDLCGNEKNMELFKATVLEADDFQKINIPVLIQLNLPASWDKTRVSEVMDEIILNESPNMDIGIKAISTDDLHMFAEITNEYLRNIHKLCSKINKSMSRLLLEASNTTTPYVDLHEEVNLKKTERSGQQTSIASLNTIRYNYLEKDYFCKAALLEDILCSSLTDVIKVELERTYVSFEEFINLHQHEIYHMCYRTKCCLCASKSQQLPPQLLDELHLRQLFDVNNRRSCHTSDVSRLCCCKAKKKVLLTAIDSYVACILLLNFCNSVFWYSCLDLQSVSLEVLLNRNKHEIFHLSQANISCCQCTADYMQKRHVPKISKDEWKLLFKQKTQPCLLHKKVKDSEEMICCRKASHGIQIGNIGYELQKIILDNVCVIKDEIRTIMNVLVDFYANSCTGIITREVFMDLYGTLSVSIHNLAYTFSNEMIYKERIRKISECLYDETMYESLLMNFRNKYRGLHNLNLNLNRSDKLAVSILENSQAMQTEKGKNKGYPQEKESQWSLKPYHNVEDEMHQRIRRNREDLCRKLPSICCKEHTQDIVSFCLIHELPLCDLCLKMHAKCTTNGLAVVAKGFKSTVKFCNIEKRITIFSRCMNAFLSELDTEMLLISNKQEAFLQSINESKKELALVIDKFKDEGLRDIRGYEIKMQSIHNNMSILKLSLQDKEKEIVMCQSQASDNETFLRLPEIEEDLQRYQNRLLMNIQDIGIDVIKPIIKLKTIGEQTFQICYDTEERPFEKLSLIQEPLSATNIQQIKDMQFENSFDFKIPSGNEVNNITGCTILLNCLMCFVDSKCNCFILRTIDGIFKRFNLPSVPLDITAISNSKVAILHQASIALIDVHETEINEFKFKISGKFRYITFHKETLIVCVSGCSFFIINLQGKKIKEINIEETLISCISCWNNKIIYANRDKNNIYSVDLDTGQSTLIYHIGGIVNSPTCIASDGCGKLFVIGSRNNNIVAISVYGKEHKELVRGFKYIRYPKATAYDAAQRLLLICSPTGDAAVYTIRK